ncbi:response regulator [Paenibacillus macerans]|uniref:response regulator n=1 Tax=Paenibacillus macerans TaxID=44252 RepID=UPI003D315F36
MKVIIIDDENLALNYLEHQLQKLGDIDIAGKFLNPFEGKQFALTADIDVIFLDIHLPEINGIELAEQLLQGKPYLNIVFVTAYDEYAIKAFELNALDYIMKPVRKERLMITLQRIQERVGSGMTAWLSSQAYQPRINMFQQLQMEDGDGRFTAIRWRTTKAQELFLYLVQHREQLVRKSALIDLLWPEYEPNKAFSQLYTAIYHIRKTLEPYGAHIQISNATEGYVLHLDHVRLDVEEWEKFILSGTPINEQTIGDYETAMELYQGDYLQDYEYWWAESERYRLKSLWLRTSFQLAEWQASRGHLDKALEVYLEICDRYPLAEEAHFALMKIHGSLDNHSFVHRQYRLLTELLAEELNEQPSAYITEWYHQWSQEKKGLPKSSV